MCSRHEIWRRNCCGASKPLFALAASHINYQFLLSVFSLLFLLEGGVLHESCRARLSFELFRSFIRVESPCYHFHGIRPVTFWCSRVSGMSTNNQSLWKSLKRGWQRGWQGGAGSMGTAHRGCRDGVLLPCLWSQLCLQREQPWLRVWDAWPRGCCAEHSWVGLGWKWCKF